METFVSTIALDSYSLRLSGPLEWICQQSFFYQFILSSIVIGHDKRDISVVLVLWFIGVSDYQNSMGSQDLETDMRMIEVRSSVSELWPNFVIEELSSWNGPLADKGSAVGEWCGSLTQTMPVLLLSALGHSRRSASKLTTVTLLSGILL
jgi:hypothetical protein